MKVKVRSPLKLDKQTLSIGEIVEVEEGEKLKRLLERKVVEEVVKKTEKDGKTK